MQNTQSFIAHSGERAHLDACTSPPDTANATLAFRPANFASLAEALDYAAQGGTGLTFHDRRGRLDRCLTYADLRMQARAVAAGLLGRRLARGDRVGIVAETGPDFVIAFFACQYAGLVAVPLPAHSGLGNRDDHVTTLRNVIRSARVRLVLAPDPVSGAVEDAAADLPVERVTTVVALMQEAAAESALEPLGAGEISHIQYSSGSTRRPRGIRITQDALMANARAVVRNGLNAGPGDRAASWLPFYHDMGLIGFLVIPVTCQLSVDYLTPEAFARQPMQWLHMISRNRSTLAFSPDFGYELCTRRPRQIESLDLSCWRVAGVGGERIRPGTLAGFAEMFEAVGFRREAFVPAYGLAEATLAVSFGALGQPPVVDLVDRRKLAEDGVAERVNGDPHAAGCFVGCGAPMPGYRVEIRDGAGGRLPERTVGRILIAGPSLMEGYDAAGPEADDGLCVDGWLDTGDLGYLAEGRLFIVGRQKDLIIVNGRNIAPQDLEWHAERANGQLRNRDTAAFAVLDATGREVPVLLAQTGVQEDGRRAALRKELHAAIFRATGIDCRIVLVPPRSLPLTSSGKLNRAHARRLYRSGAFDEVPAEAAAAG